MLRSILMTALMAVSLGATAQFSVSGTIRDAATNLALVGATVHVENIDEFSVSDESGHFQIDGLRPGTYTVRIKFIGYSDRIENLDVQRNIDLDISLQESFQLTDEVIVYATRANDKTPTTYSDVDKQTIQKQNFGQDLPLLLNWTPSLVTTSDAGAGVGYTGMRIRGSDASRINVTINGIPYNDAESQGTYWVDVPDVASSVQSIQVQRGVGTSTNGASAFGASINLQTTTLSTDPYTEIYTSFGSFKTQRYTLKTGTGLLNKHWAFDAKVSKIKSDGYVERAASDLNSYYLSGGYYGKKAVIKAIAFGGLEETYQAWYGLDAETMKINRRMNYAGAIYNSNGDIERYYDKQVDNYRQDNYQLHLSQQINPHWNASVSLHYTYGRGYYEEYHQGDSFASLGLDNVQLKDSVIESTDAIVRKWLNNKFYGTTFSLNYEKNKIHFTMGGAWNQYGDAKHFGEVLWMEHASNGRIRHRYYAGESEKTDFNVYAKLNYTITDLLTAFADLQLRNVAYETAGIDDDQATYAVNEKFNFFNPKAGLSYALSEHNIFYASYAIAHREPNRTDFLNGDTTPKAEKLGNLEIGWRRSAPKYNFEVNYYYMNYTDQLVLTGALNNVGSPIRANIGKSYRTGLEVSGTIRFSEKLSWNLNATRSLNRNKDFAYDENDLTAKKNTPLILSPDWIAGSQLTWNTFKNFQVSLLTKYVGKQYLDNTANENLTIDSYFINDIRLNYTIYTKGVKEIGFSVLLNNVFNQYYSSNGAVYDGTAYYYPQAGRNFMSMLTLKF